MTLIRKTDALINYLLLQGGASNLNSLQILQQQDFIFIELSKQHHLNAEYLLEHFSNSILSNHVRRLSENQRQQKLIQSCNTDINQSILKSKV